MLMMAVPAMAQNPDRGTTSGANSAPRHSRSPAESESPAPAASTPEKVDPVNDATIRHLMDLTGAGKIGGQMMDAMMPQMRTMINQLIGKNDRQQKFLYTFFREFRTRLTDEDIVKTIVPIYVPLYSLEEIQALNQFYESPLGQRVVRELLEITAEVRAAGAEMGRKAAIETSRTRSKDFPELDRILPDNNAPAPSPQPAPVR